MNSKSQESSTLRANQTESVEAFNLNATVTNGNLNESIAKVSANIENQSHIQQYNQLITQIKPHVTALVAAGASIAGNKIAEIAGAVWDEFNSWSKWKKFLAIIAAAAIIGGVGYFSWKLIAGNWDLITEFVGNLYQKVEQAKVNVAKYLGENTYIIKFYEMFENQIEIPQIDVSDAKNTTEAILASPEAKTMYGGFLDLLKVKTAKYSMMRDEL